MLFLSVSSNSSLYALGFFAHLSFDIGHPFDLTKTRLQTAPSGTYTGAIDVVKKILVRDGVLGYVVSSIRRLEQPENFRTTESIEASCPLFWV